MSLIQSLFLLLVVAHVLGRMAVRFRQPDLVGHMIAGIVLGPAVFDGVRAGSQIDALADFAVLFVVVTAGLEMRLGSVASVFRGRGALALLPALVLPGSLGFAVAVGSGYDRIGGLVVALCASVMALPVALRILASFHLIGTRMAQVTIAGALLADVVVLLTLGTLSRDASAGGASWPGLLGVTLLRLVALLVLVVIVGLVCKFLDSRRARGGVTAGATDVSLSLILILILLLAAASEAIGLHFVIGAFLGALTVREFTSDPGDTHPLHHQVEGLTTTVFAPLFLACQGTHFNVETLAHPLFVVALIVVVTLAKLVGGYWSARLCGLPIREAKGVGIVMNAGGVMEMVVANIAYRSGLVDASLFSTLLVVGVVTTVCTPLLLKRWERVGGASVVEKGEPEAEAVRS